MTYTGPSWSVSVGGTTISNDLLSLSMKRGRDDELSDFPAGTCTLVFDNTNGDLDALKSSSTAAGTDLGDEVIVKYGTGTTDILFTGVVSSGFAPSAGAAGDDVATSTLECVDRLGWLTQSTGAQNTGQAVITHGILDDDSPAHYTRPSYWFPGNMTGPPADGTSELVDLIESGPTQVKIVRLAGTPEIGQSLIPGDQTPSVTISGTDLLCATNNMDSVILTDTDLSVAVWFRTNTLGTTGNWLVVGRNSNTATAQPLWGVRVNAAGSLTAEVWTNTNSAGSGTWSHASATTASTAYGDGNPHLLLARFDATGATPTVYLTADLAPFTHASAAFPSAFFFPRAYIQVGEGVTSGQGTVDVGQIALYRAIATNTGASNYMFSAIPPTTGTDPLTFDADATPSGRLDTYLDASAFFSSTVNGFTVDDHYSSLATLDGFGYSESWPANISACVAAIAESLVGAAYIKRNGDLLLRDFASLSTDSYFTTEVAALTDDPNYSTAGANPDLTVRVTGRSRTGETVTRLVNQVKVDFHTDPDTTGAAASLVVYDHPSVLTYGLRDRSYSSKLQQHANLRTAAAAIVAAHKDPAFEVGDLTIRPWGDQTATDFVLDTLELEKAVLYQESPAPYSVDGALVDAKYRIISESWDWNGGVDWTVTVRIAKA